MYTTWPSAGSPAFKGLESLVLRCGIFLTLITLFVAIMPPTILIMSDGFRKSKGTVL